MTVEPGDESDKDEPEPTMPLQEKDLFSGLHIRARLPITYQRTSRVNCVDKQLNERIIRITV